jgi:hypothetical protein
MAALAAILQDGQDIFVEGRRRSFLLLGSLHLSELHRRQERHCGAENRQSSHERKNSKVNAHAWRAALGSYAERSSQKNP